MVVRTRNPLLAVLLLIAGVALMGVAFIVGAVLLAVFLGAGAVLVLVVWLRAQLLGGFPRRHKSRQTAGSSARESDVIEGEYQVRPGRNRDDSGERRRR